VIKENIAQPLVTASPRGGERREPVFDPKGSLLVWREIKKELARRIHDGTYPFNRPLPSEVALVNEFGCATGTVRHAIRALRDEGWVFTVPGRGSFPTAPEQRADARPEARRPGILAASHA
jgi:DNA-binding GntR family transcriptional regulator